MNPQGEPRERLVEYLEDTRVLSNPAVAAAMRSVPRHLFVPDDLLAEAYEDRALAIKERDGAIVSSISQPSMIVQMLQLLDIRPGVRVLEIGTGSGYNAALLATLCAPGSVLTVDIEPDLVERARAALERAKIAHVEVATPDRLDEVHTTFDRIIVTARADDIAESWWHMLADGGRIVVPLDIGYGGERAVGFQRAGDQLLSFGSYACAFIQLRTGTEQMSGVFFYRDRDIEPPRQHDPVEIIAVRRNDATPQLLASTDAVVARPVTIFGVRRRPFTS